jgi:hypothetical protein
MSQIVRHLAASLLILTFALLAVPQDNKTAPHKRTSKVKLKKSAKKGAAGVEYKEADWPNELRAGDCGQKPGTLYIGSDGSLYWEAVTYTYSTHSGDIWHAAFQLQDENRVTLASTGNHDSPRMNDGNGGPPPRYPWNANDTYDGSKYFSVVWAVEYYAC